MTEAAKLIVTHSLADFFRQELAMARDHLGLRLLPALELYVVQLLCDYAHRDDVRELLAQEPLALLQQRAANAPVALQPNLWRQLGERALYVGGFFAESLERSSVGVAYYVAMGAAAFGQLAGHPALQRRASARQLYHALSQNFAATVDLLSQIAAQQQGRSGRDTDLLKLYERYTRTKNVHTRQVLQSRGVHIRDAPDSDESMH